jgi:hypothetical protein
MNALDTHTQQERNQKPYNPACHTQAALQIVETFPFHPTPAYIEKNPQGKTVRCWAVPLNKCGEHQGKQSPLAIHMCCLQSSALLNTPSLQAGLLQQEFLCTV